MQQRKDAGRRVVINNLMWFAGSVALAFFVWMIATLDSDPISERTFASIPIRVEYDPGLVITTQRTTAATVRVRAPESTLEQLGPDDIQVVANLSQLGPGEHVVNLEASVSRRARPDTAPRRIAITLEAAQEKLIPVEAVITDALPRGFEIQGGNPQLETSQVLVSGPQSLVEQVTAARVVLNLSQRRNPFTDELRLLPVNVDGETVEAVTIDPATIQVTVPVQARSDIRQVSITPNILANTLPDGYALTSIEYDPQVILISGPPEALESAPGTVFTGPIDLTDRTSSFQITATVQLPNDRLFVLGDQAVNVSVSIEPLLSSRQFDRVHVETLGLGEPYQAAVSPSEVTILLTGPQILLDTLEEEDVRAVIDLNGLTEGNYQLAPDVMMNGDKAVLTNISVLPAELDVIVSAPTPTPTGR
jgi:YbbR domain-containing protein